MKDSYKHCVMTNVSCYNRALIVLWDEDVDTATVSDLLEYRYYQWVHVDEFPEVEYYCCEEWMLIGLDELGLKYQKIYVENANSY